MVFNWENESAEQQLAHDKFESQKIENRFNEYRHRDNELYEASLYSTKGTPLSQIVLGMMQAEKFSALYYKYQVHMDMDIHMAVNEACIQLGLSEDEYSPYLLDMGNCVEIYLVR